MLPPGKIQEMCLSERIPLTGEAGPLADGMSHFYMHTHSSITIHLRS